MQEVNVLCLDVDYGAIPGDLRDKVEAIPRQFYDLHKQYVEWAIQRFEEDYEEESSYDSIAGFIYPEVLEKWEALTNVYGIDEAVFKQDKRYLQKQLEQVNNRAKNYFGVQ